MTNSGARCSKFLIAAAAVVACGHRAPMSRPRASADDRAALGQPAPYLAQDAGPDPEAFERRLRDSVEERRRFGWQVARQVLEDVAIAAGGLSVPRWRTWYDRIDLTRLFERGMLTIGKPARKARVPFSGAQLDGLGAWNAALRPGIPPAPEAAPGLGGLTRTLYNATAARHILAGYGALAACRARQPIAPDAVGPDDNHAPCFAREFPRASVLVKTVWRRAEAAPAPESPALPVFDTSAAAVARLLASGDATWRPDAVVARPADDAIFRATTAGHASFDLMGLHIMTKELRHWVWVSLWWSPQPDADFGADRPASWSTLPPRWRNYKMCVVVDFADSWCSNPYIEDAPGMARTNCIGCHQQSGSGITGVEASTHAGTAKARANFPYDYVWSLATEPDFVAARMQEALDYYDLVDP